MARARILIVDDDAEIRCFCSIALQEKYEIIEASSVDEAKSLLFSNPPQLILLDLMMPGRDGLSLAEEMQQDDELCKIPIIIMTGTTKDSGLPPGFWKIGTPARGFLTKPFDHVKLLNEVEMVFTSVKKTDRITPGGGGYL